MALAIALLVLLVGSIVFHVVSPWWFTPLASNWGSMDDTIVLTFWITGAAFAVITVFMIYCIVKFRYQEGRRAAYEPENHKLEIWLTGITTVLVIALLAPGLQVYGDFVEVPEDASVMEAVGQQWQWSFRYPGEDGKLGTADVRNISFDNPLGVNIDDPNGQDDLVITGAEMHVAKDQPLQILLRSKDVLHDFYVPQFRAKMDLVPGLITYLWFTPTKLGTYEIICAELCGVGHYNMRAKVVVDTPEQYRIWLAGLPTFGEQMAAAQSGGVDPMVIKGRDLAQNNGCLGCHSLDGGQSLGPTWKDLFGKTETLADGSTVIVDEAYLKESTLKPNAKVVEGFAPGMMPASTLSDEEVDAIVAFIKSGSGKDTSAVGEAAAGAIAAVKAAVGVGDGAGPVDGKQLAMSKGCLACHTLDGGPGVGPTWKGLYGKTETLADGSTVLVDEEYLKESTLNPGAKIVKGFPPAMPPSQLSPEEMDALIAFMKNIDGGNEQKAAK